ncbi:hypothetical protein VHEMI08940 [[Torrubiella] hemipterigena]|uniref:Uncharacterized protein n=1 Tax=[Torrubiella] hemipterigena TaxID=1531966 RepID=A0A0A1TQL4_9HYPO|nr:hypothetical protein VHEMI08940 [[Torrubiella] hemipterigena]
MCSWQHRPALCVPRHIGDNNKNSVIASSFTQCGLRNMPKAYQCLYLCQKITSPKYPVITAVCRQSRIFALGQGRINFIGLEVFNGLVSYSLRLTRWSTAVIFWALILTLGEVLDVENDGHLEFPMWLHDVIYLTRTSNLELCLEWNRMDEWRFSGGWNVPENNVQAAFMAEFALITSKMTIAMVTRILTIHVTQQQAALSGLFGRLGEEPCQLVSVSDIEGLLKYYDFWYPTIPRGTKKKVLK